MDGLVMIYFVLKPGSKDTNHARASREAMLAYANVIEKTDSQRAKEIREWVAKEDKHKPGCGCGYCDN